MSSPDSAKITRSASDCFDMLETWDPQAAVTLTFADVFNCESDWSWRSGILRSSDLWYVIDGVGWLREEGKRTRQFVRGGDLVLLQTDHSYVAGHDSRRPLSLIAVYFELLDESGAPIVLDSLQGEIDILHAEAGGFVHDMLLRLVRCLQDGHRNWAEACFQTVVMEIINQRANTWPSGRFGDQARCIARICERIRRRPGEPIRVEALATELGVSAEHFSRLFRRVQGVSPRAFITRTRMDAARRLLLTSSHSIERIAMLLGYDSAFQFSRQFKSRTGIAPSHYRRRQARAAAPLRQ